MAGLKVTSTVALKMATDIANAKGMTYAKGRGGKLGQGWWHRFKMRFRHLLEWDIIEGQRTSNKPLDEEKSREDKEASTFLKKTYSILHKYEGHRDLGRVYNVDSVLNISDDVSNTTRECVTATLCICANGTYFPPMLTFAGFLPQGDEYAKEGPNEALYTISSSGNVDDTLFADYIKFLEPYLSKNRPIFMFCTDKSEFIRDPLIDFCLEKQIWLLNIPKNRVTYFTQPFDTIVPSLIQTIERTAATETTVMQRVVNRFRVPWLLKCALSELEQDQIVAAFRETGFLQAETLPATSRDKATCDTEKENEFRGQKCGWCDIRIGISGIHCMICRGLYHEACAAKEKGETTAICKHCLKA